MESYLTLNAVYVLLCAVVVYIFLDHYFIKKISPSGPRGLPLVGYLPFVTNAPYKKIEALRKIYGDIFSVYLGSHQVVVVSSNKIAKELFNSPAFLNRPSIIKVSFIEGGFGIISQSGKEWHNQRIASVRILRDLGLGKSFVEEIVKEEVRTLFGIIDKHNGQLSPDEVGNELTTTVSNVISTLVYGKSFPRESPTRQMLNDFIYSLFHSSHPLEAIPFLSSLYTVIKRQFDSFSCYQLYHFTKEEIKKSKATLSTAEEDVNSYITQYLHLMNEKSSDKEASSFSEEALIGNVQAFFLAGTETTKSALHWLLITMAAYPEVQAKVHKEIDDNLERNEIPFWEDKVKFPYVQCVLEETLRWRTILPFGIPRCAYEDTTLAGYFIPKYTTVVTNLFGMHRDPACWKDPETFLPERYLSEDGKSFIRREGIATYSSGRRNCPGEVMARMEIFIFCILMFQRYKVTPADGQDIDTRDFYQNVLRPKPQSLMFHRR